MSLEFNLYRHLIPRIPRIPRIPHIPRMHRIPQNQCIPKHPEHPNTPIASTTTSSSEMYSVSTTSLEGGGVARSLIKANDLVWPKQPRSMPGKPSTFDIPVCDTILCGLAIGVCCHRVRLLADKNYLQFI